MSKQSEIIKELSDAELEKQLYLSQFLLVCVSIILSFFLFDEFSLWLNYVDFNIIELIIYGVIPGLIIVIVDVLLIYFLPKRFYDDGGINERIFNNRSVPSIFLLSLCIAISEELLFRGVIQTTFGYIIASIFFAVVHFRYLTKPVLFISILFVSFYIGYMFEVTGNLLTTIIAHFLVDFLLGLVIRFKK